MYKTEQNFNISENIGSKVGGSEEDFLGKIQKELTTNYEKISCKLEKMFAIYLFYRILESRIYIKKKTPIHDKKDLTR